MLLLEHRTVEVVTGESEFGESARVRDGKLYLVVGKREELAQPVKFFERFMIACVHISSRYVVKSR